VAPRRTAYPGPVTAPPLPPTPPPHPAADPAASAPAQPVKSPAASVAWAVATIVVALVVGFLAWTWMTRDTAPPAAGPPAVEGSGGASTGDASAAEPAGTLPDGAAEGQGAQDGVTQDGAAQTLTAEQEEILLGLQRREEGDPLAVGAVDAPVVLIEYADYRCPYCASWAREVKPGLQPFVDDGTLRIEFRDAIVFGEESALVAVAARAAGEQGLYWEYHDAIFAASPTSGQADLPKERLVELAEEVDVPDLDRFEADLSSQELLDAVQADMAEAAGIGIRSTPTFVVNTVPVRGAQPLEVFTDLVEQQAATAP
jgi:protein-disulfide isomerase